MGPMIKMAMLSQMFGGMSNTISTDTTNPFAQMMPMMFMSSMISGSNPMSSIFSSADGENMFENMFKDLDFSGAENMAESDSAEEE